MLGLRPSPFSSASLSAGSRLLPCSVCEESVKVFRVQRFEVLKIREHMLDDLQSGADLSPRVLEPRIKLRRIHGSMVS